MRCVFKALVFIGFMCHVFIIPSTVPILKFKKINILGLCDYSYRQTGPASVSRSLIQGLKLLDIPFEIGVSNSTEVMDVVLVQGGAGGTLELARRLKRAGRINKLIVGPNFYPDDANFPEVDIHVVPSESIIRYCQDVAPELVSRCRVWPAGIDASYWAPTDTTHLETKKVLVYWKTEGEDFCSLVEETLRNHGWEPVRLRYGAYNQHEYKNLLTQCRFAVFISRSESQGIALAECWAMDIPTFVWNPRKAHVRGIEYDYLVASPYLNPRVGCECNTIEEFKNLLDYLDATIFSSCPRTWVLENMTDEVSVRILVDIINELFNPLEERSACEAVSDAISSLSSVEQSLCCSNA